MPRRAFCAQPTKSFRKRCGGTESSDSYRAAGHEVNGDLEDVRSLDLETVDRAVEGLAAKYGSATAVQGAAAGFAGIAAIVPDIVGLVALNLRAAGEYATTADSTSARTQSGSTLSRF